MRRENRRRTRRQKQPWQVSEKHQRVHHSWSEALEENEGRQGQETNVCVEVGSAGNIGSCSRPKTYK